MTTKAERDALEAEARTAPDGQPVEPVAEALASAKGKGATVTLRLTYPITVGSFLVPGTDDGLSLSREWVTFSKADGQSVTDAALAAGLHVEAKDEDA